jgi:enoyl-CoA hydratase/carnithine racemase
MSVRYEVAERIATITIDRPDVKNALGPEEWRAL